MQDGKRDLKQCAFFQVEVTSHSIELKKPKLPRFTANLIFRLFRFPSAHAYWLSYLDVCGDTAWYCCVHPGECFQLHSFVVHCACVRKSECVCLCVCKFGGGHSCIVEPFSASFLSGSFDTRLAHTWARPLPIYQPTPRQHTHLRTATGTVSNTQTLTLIGQKLVAAKNVLSKSGALVFFDLTLMFWWGWLDFVSSL